jgi:hypothetical protein
VREYKLASETLKIVREASGLYTVDFEYTFRVSRASESRSGRSATHLVVDASSPALQIRFENGKVLQKF